MAFRLVASPTKKGRKKIPMKFEHRLVLVNWMLDLFGVATFEDLAKGMRDDNMEGFSEEGISHYYYKLRLLIDRPGLPNDLLLAYDQNIVRHWKVITERRNAEGQKLHPKYFQYICLLFTEIYLDRYFRNTERLLDDLNAYAEQFNEGATRQQKPWGNLFTNGLPGDSRVRPYTRNDLKKLAFWSATGSGKTLLMHINILQYRHYLERHGRRKRLDHIILLTPNEGLSYQHLNEFRLSGMEADLFDKDAGRLFAGKKIEIIDIHKLRETAKEKTVSIDAFEGTNLVLVDEGHRGTSGQEVGHWMQMRNRLCENGFSFEYSATFGQAVKASGNKDLAHEYAKCILFNYSYKYFYQDGYGKEYRIMNLDDDSNEEHRRRYLTACLLAFYQQQKIYKDKKDALFRFLIEKPLWIFVGGSVTKTLRQKDISDIVDILLFLARFVKNREESVRFLDLLLNDRSGLYDVKGRELFSGSYTYLGKMGLTGESAYQDILSVLFNAASPGVLHVRRLKAGGEAEGEIALHLGENTPPFGVINVGDASGLSKLCENHAELVVTDSEFSESLFRYVNMPESSINILIGSRKFSEGWNSWRVSTMGLMNIGKKEGSQIIQLFGRGVRLKGIDFCLKRSSRVANIQPPVPAYIDKLETLNVFGIHSDYMRQFKEYLEDEGLPANEERIEFVLPVVKNLGRRPLKTIKLRKGIDFKKQGPRPTLGPPEPLMKRNKVVIDWYPKIQAINSAGGEGPKETAVRDECQLTEKHLAFLDMEELYFRLEQYKNEKAWYNLGIEKNLLGKLLSDNSWYVLYIPKEELEFGSFEKVHSWQEIAETLLYKYCDRFYKFHKSEWEKDYLEYRTLDESDPNFPQEYHFLVEKSREDIIEKLNHIKKLMGEGKFKNFEFNRITGIMFNRHLYQPLIHVNSDLVEVKPVPLNVGERDFVGDLQRFCNENPDYFQERELYLLRNMTRGHGIGFFEAGNFYPDFILWLLIGDKQYINFVDPKGLRNLKGPRDDKIEFYRKIKEIEERLRQYDPRVTLNSFIISNTPLPEIGWWDGGMTKKDFEKHHVLFQKEDKDTYIKKLLTMAVEE